METGWRGGTGKAEIFRKFPVDIVIILIYNIRNRYIRYGYRKE